VQDKLNIDIAYRGVDLGRFQKYLEGFKTMKEAWIDGVLIGFGLGGMTAAILLITLAH
jgi:hypothetical protein